MKTVIINITHDEVFEDLKNTFSKETTKASEVIINDDNIIVNITGTLEELEND